ncbi:hypothetical protein EC973_000874 [Apophysomyces ossiformis]|uniref:Uncharacterized protein n=1 Tax=Apophysomyces ossiformis TaxID=679940 RepID=A0A8H7BPW8_9FUNG|nr:hypothetical protein EC973_000874 [Apophysomyces ossiformis]
MASNLDPSSVFKHLRDETIYHAAVCCGVVIGSCAGFAAEAFSSLLISATWGAEKKQKEQWPEHTIMATEGSVASDTMDNEICMDDEEDIPTVPKMLSRDNGSSSSYWDASYFADKKAKGKQAMRFPHGSPSAIESWRSSLSRRSSSSASCPDAMQSAASFYLDDNLRRRTTYERSDDWNWVDDDGNDGSMSTGNIR